MTVTTTPGEQPLSSRPVLQLASPQHGNAGAALPRRRPPPRPAVVTLPSEIDVRNDGQVQATLARALGDGMAVLVADATGTTFCGCSGAHALVRAHHQAAATGAQLRVAASPAVLRMLELTGADHVLDTYPTLDTALADGQVTGRRHPAR
jgi:anti-anti-sigma factor